MNECVCGIEQRSARVRTSASSFSVPNIDLLVSYVSLGLGSYCLGGLGSIEPKKEVYQGEGVASKSLLCKTIDCKIFQLGSSR